MLYKSITCVFSSEPNGPYVSCAELIDCGFNKSDHVIFSEDDILFCKDAMDLYCAYFSNAIAGVDINDAKCIGVTTSSNYFGYRKKQEFEILGGKVIPRIFLFKKTKISARWTI